MKYWTPEQVDTLRKKHKLTRRALSEMLGVTVSAVYKWERGLKVPSKSLQLLLDCVEAKLKKGG